MASSISSSGSGGTASAGAGSSGINFSGLASGIDTNSIIAELLRVDRLPEQFYKDDQASLQAKQTAYNTLSAQLLNLQSSAFSLDSLRAFNTVKAASSDTTVATVTAQTGAQLGTHTISVTSLAKAQLVGSVAQASQTAPLGFTGQILINGKAITVQAADSIQSLASNINAAQAGVNASIVTPSQGQIYLTLGSNSTGIQGKISLADVGTGSLLSQLGISASGGHIVHAISGGAGSDLFSDSSTSVATLAGITNPPVATVQIQIGSGALQNVSIDLTHSLSQIASDINTALGTSAASVVTTTDPITSASRQRLQIAGATGFTDSKNVLADLGIYQQNLGAGRELTQAQDAAFTLDGLAATRSSNSFSDAISGVTINLLKDATGSTAGPPSTTLGVTSDTGALVTNISAFIKAYNDTVDLIGNQSTYDPATGRTGILFGDSTTASVANALTTQLTGQVNGLPGSTSLLSQIGITLDTQNHLNVDSTTLQAALASNLSGVAKLFQSFGAPTDPNVQFIAAGPNTQPSGSAGYLVNITQPATQAQSTTTTAQSQPLLTDETLTFGGSLFGTPGSPSNGLLTGKTITLHQGSSAADVVSQINGNTNIGQYVSASLDSTGHLQLTSKQYGTVAEFAVQSTVDAGALGNTSGIGRTILDAKGQDVAGTINGETATGNGQTLSGSQQGINGVGGGQALGLQLRITATTAGSFGSVVFTSGVAHQAVNYVNSQSDPFSGVLTTAASSFQTQYADDQTAISDIESYVADQQVYLSQVYSAMENAVSTLKSSSSGLSALLASK